MNSLQELSLRIKINFVIVLKWTVYKILKDLVQNNNESRMGTL
jgi:hypothetical protein